MYMCITNTERMLECHISNKNVLVHVPIDTIVERNDFIDSVEPVPIDKVHVVQKRMVRLMTW